MSGRSRWIGIGFAVVVILLFIWALLQTPGERSRRPESATGPSVAAMPPATPTPPARSGAVPPAEIKRSSITSVDPQGRPQWELHAEVVVVDSRAGVASLTTVRGTYFKEGEPAVTFEAPHGTFAIASRNVTLSGRVRARTTDGRAMEADVARWFPRTQQMEAMGSVVLHQGGMIVRADRLTADVALRRTRLEGNIRVTVAE